MQASFQDFLPKRYYHLFIISSVPPSITSDLSWGPGWRLLRRSVGISLRLQVELWGINNRRSPRKYCSSHYPAFNQQNLPREWERKGWWRWRTAFLTDILHHNFSTLHIHTHAHTHNKPTSIYSRCTTEQSIKHQGNGRMKLTFRPSSAQNNSEDAWWLFIYWVTCVTSVICVLC